jgi:hypothetical protein
MDRWAAAAVLAPGLAAGLVLSGCGGNPSIDSIPGDRVATMADHQLEAMNSGLAPGKMTCPSLDFTVDASVRCVRIAELSDGRQIRVLGTVSVTSTRSGGRLHVELDDKVSEFGITAEHLERELTKRAQRVLGPKTGTVTCPYLSGAPGTSVQCQVSILDTYLLTRITVTGIDKRDYRTRYRFESPLFGPRLNPALPSLLRALGRDRLAS